MRYTIIASAIAAAMCSVPAIVAAQAGTPDQPPVIQTQANPPGAGVPTATPPNPPTADAPVPPAMPADPGYQAGPYKGALTPPPAEAMAKTYPLCTRTLQDSCVNPGEAGTRTAAASGHREVHRSRHLQRH